jgi:hypothetical protein
MNNNTYTQPSDLVVAWKLAEINLSNDDALTIAMALYRTTEDYSYWCDKEEGYDGSRSFYNAVEGRYKENILYFMNYMDRLD